jgi:hypothetical protein
VVLYWDGTAATEEKIKDLTKATTIRCIPLDRAEGLEVACLLEKISWRECCLQGVLKNIFFLHVYCTFKNSCILHPH